MHSEDEHKDLIRKYISGKYTPEEWTYIRQLMKAPNAKQLFDDVLAEQWTGLQAEQNVEQEHLNQHLALFYEKLAQQTQVAERSVDIPVSVSIYKKRWFQYAAVWLVLILGIGWYALNRQSDSAIKEQIVMREMVNPNGQRSKILLPDSSVVFLGAGSRLSFPERFQSDRREVKLEGAAFFEVTKNPKKPFIIHTGSVQTKVLGTSFKIEAYTNQPISVAVATGKVRVDRINKLDTTSLAILNPGQLLTYDLVKVKMGETDISELQGWKKAQINFHNNTLQEITDDLTRWYGIAFSYRQPAKAQEKISIMLQVDMPLEKIMNILSATGHFNYKITAKQVTIDTKDRKEPHVK